MPKNEETSIPQAADTNVAQIRSIIPQIYSWSRSCIIEGTNPDHDLRLLEREVSEAITALQDQLNNFESLNKLFHINEWISDFEFKPETKRYDGNQIDHINIKGNVFKLENIPENAANLTAEVADILVDRFNHAYLNNFSDGSAATCFENQINYFLGQSKYLTPIQRGAIMSCCRIVSQRPLPTLFMAHHILKHMNNIDALRIIISSSIWNKNRNIIRTLRYAEELYDRFVRHNRNYVSILLIGFSQSQIQLLSQLKTIAATKTQILRVGVFYNFDNGRGIDAQSIKKILRHNDIDVQIVDPDSSDFSDFSFALSNSKLITWSKTGDLHVLADRSAVLPYSRAMRRHRRNDQADSLVPVVATGAVFKIWPRNFRSTYRNLYKSLDMTAVFRRSAYLSRSHLKALITELGVIDTAEFSQSDLIRRLDDRSVAEKILFHQVDNVQNFNADRDILSSFVEVNCSTRGEDNLLSDEEVMSEELIHDVILSESSFDSIHELEKYLLSTNVRYDNENKDDGLAQKGPQGKDEEIDNIISDRLLNAQNQIKSRYQAYIDSMTNDDMNADKVVDFGKEMDDLLTSVWNSFDANSLRLDHRTNLQDAMFKLVKIVSRMESELSSDTSAPLDYEKVLAEVDTYLTSLENDARKDALLDNAL